MTEFHPKTRARRPGQSVEPAATRQAQPTAPFQLIATFGHLSVENEELATIRQVDHVPGGGFPNLHPDRFAMVPEKRDDRYPGPARTA